MFIDRAKIIVVSGAGGDGMVSFRREKYVPRGGPSGGDGGKGGSVFIKANSDLNTLINFRRHRKFAAKAGANGGAKEMFGKNAEDVFVEVPLGTMVYDNKTGELLADMTQNGQEALIVKGGHGGRGNSHFATSAVRAPLYAEKGEPGEEKELRLELKVLADVGLLGFPKMGVTGAAVATVIGQCVAGIVAGTCNHKYNHDVSLSFKGFRPDIRLIGHIYAVGIPSIIMQSIGSIMTYSMNRILIEFSSTATAVFGVYFKLQSFFFMPVFGLNNGITPIIAYNYGAQQRNRMIKTIRISLTTAFCLTFIGFLCFEGIPQVLLGMFNASDAMLKIGVPALRIIGIHYLIAWFCIIAGTVFQALGKAVFSMIVSIMRQLVVLIPSAYILSKIGGLHIVWWAFPIAEVISFIVSTAFLIKIYKTIISKIPEGKL